MHVFRARRVTPVLCLLAACGGGSSGEGGQAGSTTMITTTSTGGEGGGGGAMSTTSSSGGGGAAGCVEGTTEACYEGPAGTETLGACKPGVATCQSDGTFGPCEGQVLPAPESCGTPVDDDCNGATNEGCICAPGDVQACYGGPPGTEGQGICKAGSKTCAPDGLSFLPCVGEVQPQVENCLASADEDCDGTAATCTGAGVLSVRFGDAAAQSATAVANLLGGPVITGAMAGTVDFGGGAMASAGGNDVFVASLDYTGAYVWAKRFGDTAAQTGVDVAADKQGATIVIGDFAGKLDFDGTVLTSAGSTDVFVAKLDGGGGVVWARRFGNNVAQNGKGIAVDDVGNVYVTGSFSGTIDFGGGALTSAGGTDVFVAKLDKDGNHVWSRQFGDASAQSGKAVAVDKGGNVVVAGEVAGSIDFGGGPLTSAGGNDLFVVSLDATGNMVWGKIFGNNAAQSAGGVAVDDIGNVYVAGPFAGKIDLGGGLLTSAGGNDIYVAKLTQGGLHLWSRGFGASGADVARDISVDRFGGVVIVGDFAGSVNFGGGALTAGGTDAFALKLDPLGGHVWSRKFGDAAAQSAVSVSADESGVLLAGTFAGAVDFGAGALTSAGGNDVFVAKLAP